MFALEGWQSFKGFFFVPCLPPSRQGGRKHYPYLSLVPVPLLSVCNQINKVRILHSYNAKALPHGAEYSAPLDTGQRNAPAIGAQSAPP